MESNKPLKLENKLEPKNYREYSIALFNNIDTFIAILGHPIRYNQENEKITDKYSGLNPEEVLTFLKKDKSIDMLISFSDINYSSEYRQDEQDINKKWSKMSNNNNVNSHVVIPLEDYQPPSLYQFNLFYQTVLQNYNKKIAVYCGEGFGRSGAMFAGLCLVDVIKNEMESASSEYLNYNGDKSETVLVNANDSEEISEIGTQSCTPLVKMLIEGVRNIHNEYGHWNELSMRSVETKSQIDALCNYEYFLIKQYQLKHGLRKFPDEIVQLWNETSEESTPEMVQISNETDETDIVKNVIAIIKKSFPHNQNSNPIHSFFEESKDKKTSINELIFKIRNVKDLPTLKTQLNQLYVELLKDPDFQASDPMLDALWFIDTKLKFIKELTPENLINVTKLTP